MAVSKIRLNEEDLVLSKTIKVSKNGRILTWPCGAKEIKYGFTKGVKQRCGNISAVRI